MATVRAKTRPTSRQIGFQDLDGSKPKAPGSKTIGNRPVGGQIAPLNVPGVAPGTNPGSGATARAATIYGTPSGSDAVYRSPTMPGQPSQLAAAAANGGSPMSAVQQVVPAAGTGSLQAASGSPGGSGGNGGALPYSGDPFTGFASRYVPGKADDIFANPGIVLQDVLRGMGIANPEQSGYYYELEPLADVVNEIMLMSNPNANGAGSPESAINYMASFFQNMGTPGGRAPDFRTLEANLNGADPTSALGLFLGGANDQRTQMQNFLKMGRAAAEIGLHPYYADAYNQKLAMAANAYMGDTAKGNTAQFRDFYNDEYGDYFR